MMTTSIKTADRVNPQRRILDRNCPTSKSVPKTRRERRTGCKPLAKPALIPQLISKLTSPFISTILPRERSVAQCCNWLLKLLPPPNYHYVLSAFVYGIVIDQTGFDSTTDFKVDFTIHFDHLTKRTVGCPMLQLASEAVATTTLPPCSIGLCVWRCYRFNLVNSYRAITESCLIQ